MDKKSKLLIVSLDAVSSNDLKFLAQQPAFSSLLAQGTLVSEVSSVFISNTYPIHTSMISGVFPSSHGIIDNTYLQFANPEPYWRWYYKLIQSENIVSQALKHNYKIASIFWPVMAKAPIKYNIPEIIARDHENQILAVLKNSTKLFALSNFLKYGKKVQGSKQPELDDFSTQVACGLLAKKQVDLLLLHLTDIDTTKHQSGINSEESRASLLRMDQRLAALVTAAANNYQIMIVSDHSQVDVNHHIDLNSNNPFPQTWWHLSEGIAVLLEQEKLSENSFQELKKWISSQEYFRRFITPQEMQSSGFDQHSRLAITAAENYTFCTANNQHIGNHGYPLDLPDYHTFYYVRGEAVQTAQVLQGGSVLDVCPLALRLLKLPAFPNAGRIRSEIFEKP